MMKNPPITECPWDLNSYFGRWMYYSWITSPKLNFVSNTTIKKSKILRFSYICGSVSKDITDSQVLYAKQVYENAFHPHTGELLYIFGRLSFLPIGKAILIATLFGNLTKCSSSYIWHGLNQSYDSLVNFSYRNGDTKLNQTRFGISILTATATSTFAAFQIEKFLLGKICNPLIYRFIPLSSLLVASIINVPIMRHHEIVEGVGIYDCNKDKIGYSKLAAVKGIGETIITRTVILAPGIILIQYLEDLLDNKNCWFRKNKWSHFIFRSIGCGLIKYIHRELCSHLFSYEEQLSRMKLTVLLPTACAIFPQFSSIESCTLRKFDQEAYSQITKNCSTIPNKVYFNKGL